ncbi:MAG: DUF885 family protein [Phycisphaerales bacterium]
MRTWPLVIWFVLCGAMLAPRAGAQPSALKAILDEHVEWLYEEDPLEAVRRGEERFWGRMRDESPAAYNRRLEQVRDRLARLTALAPEGLSESERVDADLLRYELERYIDGARFHGERMPLDARSGPQVWLPQLGTTLPVRTAAQQAGYAATLEQISRQIDEIIEEMRLGLEEGRVPPRAAMIGADAAAGSLGSSDFAEHPTRSPFFDPLRALPPEDPSASRAREAIRTKITPAFARLGAFLRDEYIPRCRQSIGASDSLDGAEWYWYLLRGHTTTPLTPSQIHEIGLKEVARIRAEMFDVIARSDFRGKSSLSGDRLFDAFTSYLRHDSRFYYTDAADLMSDYRALCKRIDAELPKFFGTLPRNTYGVRELPLIAARTSPSAYYYPGSLRGGVPGYFMVNTYELSQRPKYDMVPLALHEAVPGHHLQGALTQELEGVHPFRTFTGYTAFVEGWALYAERLGLEMSDADAPDADRTGTSDDDRALWGGRGLFRYAYDDFGRLSFEMWRACRLVVDTGIHSKGWTRQQAIDYVMQNTALSRLNIEREVDRYIGWPGQACGYKIGELKIRELRERAERTLGDRFDIRAFHDAVLGAGALPLPVLEARIDRWIAAGGRQGGVPPEQGHAR